MNNHLTNVDMQTTQKDDSRLLRDAIEYELRMKKQVQLLTEMFLKLGSG